MVLHVLSHKISCYCSVGLDQDSIHHNGYPFYHECGATQNNSVDAPNDITTKAIERKSYPTKEIRDWQRQQEDTGIETILSETR